MSEPQLKQAILQACSAFFNGEIYASDAQANIAYAIDAALAERDKRIAELEAVLSFAEKQWKDYAQKHEDAEAACNYNIKRLSSLQALMEKVYHSYPVGAPCENPSLCNRCAYEKWLKDS